MHHLLHIDNDFVFVLVESMTLCLSGSSRMDYSIHFSHSQRKCKKKFLLDKFKQQILRIHKIHYVVVGFENYASPQK